MNKSEMIDRIIEKEWPMFHSVNGDDVRASCQNDFITFRAMRGGQFEAWDEETVSCYLCDVTAAEKAGRNLPREKYIRMMRSSAPDEYEYFTSELPAVNDGKRRLVDEINARMLKQTEVFRKKYPALGMFGRPVYASEDNGDTSIETYQAGELLTYSEETLSSLLQHILTLEAQGRNLAAEIMEKSLVFSGFANLDEAENAAAHQLSQLLNQER